MTAYGMNPSFARHTGRLPTFSDFVRRGRRFEVFDASGAPTGEASPLMSDGWPDVSDGRWHGVRVFSDMGGTMPEGIVVTDALHGEFGTIGGHPNSRIILRGRDDLWIIWKDFPRRPVASDPSGRGYGGFHGPSLAALRSWRPSCLRTLDWQLANTPRDWTLPDVSRKDPLQATDLGMAVELQARAANLCECYLWWTAPARYDLEMPEYERRLEGHLRALRDVLRLPPIVQYGNELWNDRLGPGAWLRRRAAATGSRVSDLAAAEIEILRRVGDRVFGPPDGLGRPSWYLFVDGNREDPAYLDRVLGRLPEGAADMAGPAAYVGPEKADREAWVASGYVPSQDELRGSCAASLARVQRRLAEHRDVAARHRVGLFSCYEAGQSLLAGSAPWRAAALQAQTEAWMGDLYRSLRGVLEQEQVRVACWYSLATDQEPTDARVDVFGLTGGLYIPDFPKASAARGP